MCNSPETFEPYKQLVETTFSYLAEKIYSLEIEDIHKNKMFVQVLSACLIIAIKEVTIDKLKELNQFYSIAVEALKNCK